jgi:hypothetical protein
VYSAHPGWLFGWPFGWQALDLNGLRIAYPL